ncbi:hypothetical protein MMC13_002590 [Lambiella insularis]|nr:hypothetical protein [Lambiella insularis]
MSRNASIGDDPISRLSRNLSATSMLQASIQQPEAIHDVALEYRKTQNFRKIGEGWCGIVFEHTDPSTVLKKAKNKENGTLWNDYVMQTRVHGEFARAQYLFGVQRPPYTTHVMYFSSPPESDKWWAENISKFPVEYQEPSHMPFLCLERIPPLSREIREDLIDVFCPEKIREEAKNEAANNDCIARLYLGRRREQNARPQKYFSLRNFPLRVNMAEELHLDTDSLAVQMAIGLAICHWRARVDANDVEFVLGGPSTALNIAPFTAAQLENLPEGSDTTPSSIRDSSGMGMAHLWMLDYDKCRNMMMNEEGVKGAARAAEDNDPYFPKPHMSEVSDQELWQRFKTAYLEASQTIMRVDEIQGEMLELPAKFLREWEDYRKVKIAKQNEIRSVTTSEDGSRK